MKPVVCLLMEMDARAEAIAKSAARLAFPHSVVTTFNTLDEALKSEPASEEELVVLASPDKTSLARAIEATDANGLRRWAIVMLSEDRTIEGVESVSPEDWNETLLARAFKSAITQHRLLRENARLRGDLRTVAYRISHDMRTPLGGVVSAGELLKEMLRENDPSLASLTQPIFDSTDELMKLISRVSFLLKASINTPVKKRILMGEVVAAVLQRLERRIIERKATVSQPDDWPEVPGVAPWLETVWWNFIVNALQHAGESPGIQIGWQRQEGEYRFWIRDAGGDIPPEKCNKLFQPFNLLHQPDSTRGLGLSIVQRLVEFQGGRCGYEPASSSAASFFFTLPIEDVSLATSNPKDPAS